jgi:PmbA protein
VELTRALQPDPHRHLPDPALYEGRSDADLASVDPGLAELTPDQRIERCSIMNARMRDKPKVISATSSMYDGRYRVAAASSNGFEGAWEATSAALSGSVTMRDADDKRPEEGMGYHARALAELPDPDRIGDESLQRAQARLGTIKGPSMTATMVVERMAVGRLFAALLQPAGGRSVQQGRSFWVDKLGKPMISRRLVVFDDPLVVGGLGSRPFDDEGIAAKRLPIFEGGALQNYFLDTYYASKLGMKPTTSGMSNLVVSPGKTSRDAIIASVKKGVYVTSWLGGNSDSTSGDFSIGLRGFAIEKGKLGAPVGEMNVTGNIVQLFSRLEAVGNDPWTYSPLRCPTLAFGRVEFSGA